jgi:hypothetical protein
MHRLLKYFLTFLLWRNYKVLIVSTLLLVLSIILINMGHSDYLVWAQMQEPVPATGMSFIYKYLAYVALLFGFGLINHYANKKAEAEELAQPSKANIILDTFDKIKPRTSSATKKTAEQAKAATKKAAKHQAHSKDGDKPDPFANIRKKKKLRSQADIVIEKKK